jgi:hypothetical protein
MELALSHILQVHAKTPNQPVIEVTALAGDPISAATTVSSSPNSAETTTASTPLFKVILAKYIDYSQSVAVLYHYAVVGYREFNVAK